MPLKGRTADVTNIELDLRLDEGPGINRDANPTKTAWSVWPKRQSPKKQPWMNIRTPKNYKRKRRQPVRTFRTVNGRVPRRWDPEEMALAESYEIFTPLSPYSSRLTALGPASPSSSPRRSHRVTPIRHRHTSPKSHHHTSPKSHHHHHHHKKKKSFLQNIWDKLRGKGGKKSKKSRKRHRRTRKN
jgi:hypothetical protein